MKTKEKNQLLLSIAGPMQHYAFPRVLTSVSWGKFKIGLIFTSLLIITCFSACKKKKADTPDLNDPAKVPKGTFELHLHTYIDNNEVDAYNIAYTTDLGRKISLSTAQLYVTNIQLIRLDGSAFDFTGKKILKVLDQETYIIGEAPVGNYKSIRFKVGLDPGTNSFDPLKSADSAILNRPEMWFGGTAQPDGYIFMNVQGKIDTTADASGSLAQMQPFTYKIGTDANYRQISMPDKNFTIAEGQAEFGHILIDYNKLFAGIALNKPENLSVTSVSANSSTPATLIISNIPSMFMYEQ
jgi:hypothetical protein